MIKNILFINTLFLIYLLILFISKGKIFYYRFDKTLLNKYFLSQDIPNEVAGKRVFLSDEEIYISSGYLYAKGHNPINYNFAYPPLTKYLIGFSIIYFNNPYLVQLIFGTLLIILTYTFSFLLFKNSFVSFLSSLLLTFDPLFINLSNNVLLDLSQSVFVLLYVTIFLKWPNNYFIQGIILGLLAATKFWPTPIFFTIFLFFYIYLQQKKLKLKNLFFSLVIAFFVYNLTYFKTFFDLKWHFNPIFFNLKVLKYHWYHNKTPIFGSTLFMFLTGYFKSWWDKYSILKVNEWIITWPLSLMVSLYIFFSSKVNKKIRFLYLLPFFYLLFISFQPPFNRYFIVILPFLYTYLSYFILSKFFSKDKF